jgi:hypothetical protein
MSKNLTRKGLVFGAVVALTSTAISGTPAFAANELNLQPSTGTTYGSIIGETFTLSTNTNPGYAAGEVVKLKYNVTNAGKAALTITAGAEDGSYTNGTSVNAGAADNSNYVVTPTETSTSVANVIKISTAATATSSVGVQSWIDADLDSVIDAGEWSSAVQTITFNKASEVTWTTEFTAPAIGDTKFLAYVSATPSINVAQLATSTSILFSQTTDSKSQLVALAASNYDSTTGKLKFNNTFSVDTATPSAAETAVIAGKRYTAQAAFKVGGSEAAADVVGSAVAYSVAAATITTIAAPVSADSDNTKTTGTAVAVRASATSVPVSILVSGAAGALKNTAVTVYLEENAIGGVDTNATTAVGNYDTSSFVAGGVTLKDTTTAKEKVSFSATTDADGKVIFNIAASAQAGDAIKVWAAAQGVNTTPTNSAVYTWTAVAPASVVNSDLQGTSAVLKKAAGSSFTLNFTVIDNFGAAIPTADKYRVAITDGAAGAYNVGNQFYPVVTAGKASQSITLLSTDTTKTYNFKVQTKGTDGNYTDAAVAGTALTVVVGTSNAASTFTALSDITTGAGVTNALSDTATNALTVAGTRTAKLDTVAFVAGNKNLGATNSVKGTLTTGFSVAGVVSDSTTAGTYSTVTLSGANLNFVVDSKVYASGTVTVQTDANGAYAGIRVLSNKSGEQTLTITAGSVSKSYVVDFGAPAEAAGTTLSITAPAIIKSGRTLTVVAKLVDKFGNPVAVTNAAAGAATATLSYEGPGFTTSTITQTLDAKGTSTFRVLLGAADAGAANVTFTYDADGTTATESKITKTSTILVGVSSTVAAAKKAASATVKNAAGLTVKVVSGTKSVTKVATSDSYKVSLTKLTAGKKTVKVYVEGILVLSKSVTVKK